jgi:hypothetical protein
MAQGRRAESCRADRLYFVLSYIANCGLSCHTGPLQSSINPHVTRCHRCTPPVLGVSALWPLRLILCSRTAWRLWQGSPLYAWPFMGLLCWQTQCLHWIVWARLSRKLGQHRLMSRTCPFTTTITVRWSPRAAQSYTPCQTYMHSSRRFAIDNVGRCSPSQPRRRPRLNPQV